MESLKAFWHKLWDRGQPVPPREVKLNHDTGMLKILACLLMLCDHMGKMIFPDAFVLHFTGPVLSYLPDMNILRAIGRLAMPMFAYGVAVGCNYTRNIWKYAFRLFLLAVLVHPLYQEAMGWVRIGKFTWEGEFPRQFYNLPLELYRYYYQNRNLNILFTLTLAVLIIGGFRQRRYLVMVLAVLLTVRLNRRIDYGYEGVFLVILFYAFLDRPLVSFIAVTLFFVNWCCPRLLSQLPYNLVKENKVFRFSFNELAFKGISTEIYALLSLPFIYFPLRKRFVKLPKWLFYGFYPAHLMLIYLLQLNK